MKYRKQAGKSAVVLTLLAEHARGVSQQFERVRALLRRVLTNARVDPRDPIVVLAVNSERRLRELLPQFWERKDLLRRAIDLNPGFAPAYARARLADLYTWDAGRLEAQTTSSYGLFVIAIPRVTRRPPTPR